MGLPFLSGFYSKELIIESLFLENVFSTGINLLYCILIIATLGTGIYSMRLSYYLFFRGSCLLQTVPVAKQPVFIQAVLVLLAVSSCTSGYILSDIYSPFFNFATTTPQITYVFSIEIEVLP